MSGLADEWKTMQRMAVFSAKLRGHELGDMRAGNGFARATCIRCQAELRVYTSLFQPDMDGTVLDRLCGAATKSAA